MKIYVKESCSDIQKAKDELLKLHFSDGKDYEIQYMPNGKPILVRGREQAGYISISHTGDTLVMAFSDKPVGIDIERRNRSVSPKICGSIEEWTKREAYGKWLGVGLNKDVLSATLPDSIINTFNYGEYVVSACGEETKDGAQQTLIDNVFNA